MGHMLGIRQGVGGGSLTSSRYFAGYFILNRLDPDLYELPRLGNVVAKTEGCGTNPEKAKALGCIFDPMNSHRTGPECFYEEGSKNAQA
jgi:hypothetical protein